jgi:hypothetical protein
MYHSGLGFDVRPATCRNPRQVCRLENNKSGTRDVLRTVSKYILNGLEAPAGIFVPPLQCRPQHQSDRPSSIQIWPHIITYLAYSVSATIPFGHSATRAPGITPIWFSIGYPIYDTHNLGQQGINKYAHPCNCSLGSPRMAGCPRDRRGKYIVDRHYEQEYVGVHSKRCVK